MAINAQPAPMTVADYCDLMNRHQVTINRDYQRSDKVWPPAARSFLIQSILQGYPIPKFFLYQITDVKSKKTIKEIVDGQQRSRAINDYFNDGFPLSKSCEIQDVRGKRYSELHPDYQAIFLSYPLSIDLFLSATPEDIREAFRRLNSYTIPLNPEEKRNAEHQGAFKWFIYKLSREWEKLFLAAGVFGIKQIIRMQDTKLLADITYALLNGIKTTKSQQLDALYSELNRREDFGEEELQQRFSETFDSVLQMPELFGGALMKQHIFYSLFLAVSHMLRPCARLTEVFPVPADFHFDRDIAISNLSRLAQSIDEDDFDDGFREFVEASRAKTNTADSRQIRFRWMCRALQPEVF